MANDRIYLYCRACKIGGSVSPLLAKYWATRAQLWKGDSEPGMEDWLSEHLVACAPKEGGTLGPGCGLEVVNEDQAATIRNAAEKQDADGD